MARLVEATDEAVADAARRLRSGQVVAFPTETVYGLGARTFDPAALEAVYRLKGRPPENPLIAHVESAAQAQQVVGRWDDRCERLVARFWPGPLTLVLPKTDRVPAQATAGRETIGVRAPAHPVAMALLARLGDPISAPSANRSGHLSPTTAAHVAEAFADEPDLIVLDGGRCELGLESTVLDVTTPSGPARLLRPGSVSVEDLRVVLGEIDCSVLDSAQAPRPAGYAPSTPAELVGADDLDERLRRGTEQFVVICFDPSRVPSPHQTIAMPSSAQAYAARLYEALREADAVGAGRIIIEEPPRSDGLWATIRDRLRRATGKQ